MKAIYRQLGVLLSLGFMISIAILIYAYLQSQESIRYAQFPLIFGAILGLTLSGVFSIVFLYLGQDEKIDVIYTNRIIESKETDTGTKQGIASNAQKTEQSQGLPVKKLERIIIENQYNKKQLLDEFLKGVASYLEASVGIIYLAKALETQKIVEVASTYAYYNPDKDLPYYEFGQGLVGQVAKNGKLIQIDAVPEGYVQVVSGLGVSTPNYLMIFPVKNEEDEILAIIELASFRRFEQKEEKFLNDVALLLAKEIETNEYQKLSL